MTSPSPQKDPLIPLEKSLLNDLGRCVRDFELIAEGDRIMVGLSGGKDSYTLMWLLERLRRRSPVNFELLGVTLDQGQPGFEGQRIAEWCKQNDLNFELIYQDTYSIVLDKTEPGKTYCSLCSRLRRGILYRHAEERGCNKIALGHHRDDLIETLLLNLFYSGQTKAMPATMRTHCDRFDVIRPLAYVDEQSIIEFAAGMEFPILPCNLCGSQDGMHRQKVKALISELHAENPAVKGNLLHALTRVVPTHLLDRELLTQWEAGGGQEQGT